MYGDEHGELQCMGWMAFCATCNSAETAWPSCETRKSAREYLKYCGWVYNRSAGGWQCDECTKQQVKSEPPQEVLAKEYPGYYHPTNGKRRRRWGLSAFKAGWKAAHGGQHVSDNPYDDHRTTNGSVTFARGYRNSWRRGYTAYENYNQKED